MWIEHIDGGTLMPTGDADNPVQQRVKMMPTRIVNFPDYSIQRMYMTPRPELERRGWGMAPPEKAYLAIEMLFRGDRYYANLLLDTPEAGILDLIDMSEQDAEEWIAGAKALFMGTDGFKVPVLYQHSKAAAWIPFNRPPIDMMYDKVTTKYAQILGAAYGMTLSDIGLGDTGGRGSLAGVIRQERVSRRSGQAFVRAKIENAMDNIIGEDLKFEWKIDDEDATLAKGRAMLAYVQGLTGAKDAGMMSPQELRYELVASGVLKVEIDPEDVPVPPPPPPGLPGAPGASGTSGGKPGTPAEQGNPAFGGVPATSGGRGGPTPFMAARAVLGMKTSDELRAQLSLIIKPALERVILGAEEPRLRRLVRAVTKTMVPSVARTFGELTDAEIDDYWLPQMIALDFEDPASIENLVVRDEEQDLQGEIDKHLAADPWWQTATSADKEAITAIMRAAFAAGAVDAGERLVKSLYEAGQRDSYAMTGFSFTLRNKATLALLDEKAAQLVRWVDDATKTFIRRVVVAGVRQGLSSPDIAQALRDGASAETVLNQEGYVDDAIKLIREGLTEMTEARTNSIVNTEIARAECAGRLEQFQKSGLKQKAWVHRGSRGVTAAGNIHPCDICAGNEDLGFVTMDYLFDTVFEPAPAPPAHPNVCHCDLIFNEQELLEKVGTGDYKPWNGR
jgi:hypothetical protein